MPAPYRDEDCPGCESFHLPASEADHYDGRLEFRDGATETAWKIPETPVQHEGPSRERTRIAVIRRGGVAARRHDGARGARLRPYHRRASGLHAMPPAAMSRPHPLRP